MANSAWYIDNFRTSTVEALSAHVAVNCLHPHRQTLRLASAQGAVTSRPFYLDAASQNLVKEAWALLSLTWQLVRVRPTIVFSFNPKTNLYALVACFLLRVPCVPNVSGVGVASQLKGLRGIIYRRLVGYFFQRAPHTFFQNADDYRTFVKAGWVRPERAEVLPGSGVDLKRFQPTPRTGQRICFLMASRLITPKGVVEYLEAARRVLAEGGGCRFLLAGVPDTSSRAVDQRLLADLVAHPHIQFLGHVENMPSLLKEVDCVVLPSYYPEGVPRSLIEAAAAGKILITTDTPGCRDVVVEGHNGLFVAPRSVESLADAMLRVLALSEQTRAEMGHHSRALAEARFDERLVVRRYLELVEQFTNES